MGRNELRVLQRLPKLNLDKLNVFIGQFVTDLGLPAHSGMVVTGEKLGLYLVPLAGNRSLARRTGLQEVHSRSLLRCRIRAIPSRGRDALNIVYEARPRHIKSLRGKKSVISDPVARGPAVLVHFAWQGPNQPAFPANHPGQPLNRVHGGKTCSSQISQNSEIR
jgi:hypothetical protein